MKRPIDQLISAHQDRDAVLRDVFLEKKINLREPRTIECHFWTWSKKDAMRLAAALESRGFEILIRRPAAIADDLNRWNVEAAITQSIDFTMKREFIDDLVRLADSHGGLYDGWGTLV